MKITKRQLRRIVREERTRLYEDTIDSELDNLKKNIGDDIEHIRDLKDDVHDDHEEELRAEKEKERKDESFRRRRMRSKIRRLVREEHGADWGMGSHEDSRTRPGEEDYTGHTGDHSKTHAGEDYEGDGVEGKAMDAMKAIHDLASAAGVDLETSAGDHSDADAGDIDVAAVGLPMESRRRRKAVIRKIVRENTRKSKAKRIRSRRRRR